MRSWWRRRCCRCGARIRGLLVIVCDPCWELLERRAAAKLWGDR